MTQLIDIVHEEIDRLASMADMAGIEFRIFCSNVDLVTKVKTVKPLVDVVVWKTIRGFPNYAVSNKGEVMNLKTKRILKTRIDRGYQKIDLCEDSVRKTCKVHILVASAHAENLNGLVCVDHIDRCKTNNDVSNLRWCSHSQNSMNRSKWSNTTSTYKGVAWHKQGQKWCARIMIDGERKHIGLFTSEVQAAVAYNNAAIIHFKEFACLNVIPPENFIDI